MAGFWQRKPHSVWEQWVNHAGDNRATYEAMIKKFTEEVEKASSDLLRKAEKSKAAHAEQIVDRELSRIFAHVRRESN